MKTKEVVDALGFMIGIIIGALVLSALGFRGLWLILGAAVVGMAGGYVAEKIYASRQPPPDDPWEDEEGDQGPSQP